MEGAIGSGPERMVNEQVGRSDGLDVGKFPVEEAAAGLAAVVGSGQGGST